MNRSERFSYETSGNHQPVRADIVLDATKLIDEQPKEEKAPAQRAPAGRAAPERRREKRTAQADNTTEEKAEKMAKKKKKSRVKLLPILIGRGLAVRCR